MITVELTERQFQYLQSAVERDLDDMDAGLWDDGDPAREIASAVHAVLNKIEQTQVYKH